MARKSTENEKLKEQANNFLARVPEDKVFWCHGGKVFRNMNELADGLSAMSDETFSFHSNLEKKDFSNWVREVIQDEELADDLVLSSTRQEAAEHVARRIAYLVSVLTPAPEKKKRGKSR